jgi:transcription factor Pcc1
VSVTVRRRCRSPGAARSLRDAVSADTPEFVRLELDGSSLVVRLTAPSAASARATLDDLLACLAAAERATGTPV